MRKPMNRNASISTKRIENWLIDFRNYRHAVTEPRIERWIKQFKPDDRDIAARILDCVDFITSEQTSSLFKSALESLDGWHTTKKNRVGKWRFAPFSSSSGESGDRMIADFRRANGLSPDRYSELFIYRRDLLEAKLGSDDSVVLVDDFIATGDQACKAWANWFNELLPHVGNVYLVVLAARIDAITKVHQETGMQVVPGITLEHSDDFYSPKCKYFSKAEKETVSKYGKKASKSFAKGYGEHGSVVVFSHTCPNNTLPILHNQNSKWDALFRRYDS